MILKNHDRHFFRWTLQCFRGKGKTLLLTKTKSRTKQKKRMKKMIYWLILRFRSIVCRVLELDLNAFFHLVLFQMRSKLRLATSELSKISAVYADTLFVSVDFIFSFFFRICFLRLGPMLKKIHVLAYIYVNKIAREKLNVLNVLWEYEYWREIIYDYWVNWKQSSRLKWKFLSFTFMLENSRYFFIYYMWFLIFCFSGAIKPRHSSHLVFQFTDSQKTNNLVALATLNIFVNSRNYLKLPKNIQLIDIEIAKVLSSSLHKRIFNTFRNISVSDVDGQYVQFNITEVVGDWFTSRDESHSLAIKVKDSKTGENLPHRVVSLETDNFETVSDFLWYFLRDRLKHQKKHTRNIVSYKKTFVAFVSRFLKNLIILNQNFFFIFCTVWFIMKNEWFKAAIEFSSP